MAKAKPIEYRLKAPRLVLPMALPPRHSAARTRNFARPITLRDFNKSQRPLPLSAFDLRPLYAKLGYKPLDVATPIPFDPRRRQFLLPRKMRAFASLVRAGLRDIESIAPLETIIGINVLVTANRVRWGNTLIPGEWHHDGSGAYDPVANSYAPRADGHAENMFFLTNGFPFNTQFATRATARQAIEDAIARIPGYENLPRRTPPIESGAVDLPGRFAGFSPATVHRSPRMPSSAKAAHEMLGRAMPAIPPAMRAKGGLKRIHVNFEVFRYHPRLGYAKTKNPRARIHKRFFALPEVKG
jgi:hypothetical protein